jgi:hypothetical protein
MIAISLTLLFTCAGLFALASIGLTLRLYGASALRLRQALRDCSQERELRFAITELLVAPAQAARILRPDFGARNRVHLAPARLRDAA